MNKFIRYYNQNRKKVWIAIIIIAFAIFMIQIVNQLMGELNKQNAQNENTIAKTQPKDSPSTSVITGTKVEEEQTKENTTIIKEFVDLCNKKEYEKAYELLGKTTKENLYKNVDAFRNKYVDDIFKTEKTYKLELWMAYNYAYTYKINYYEDNLLQTGNVSNRRGIEDYISIVKEDNELKLNINKLIKETKINKQKQENGIEIKINSKIAYKDYETYNITIKNTTKKDILLNDGQKGNNLCLIDQNNNEYISYINEIPMDSLIINSGYQKSYNIRFNKIYDAYRTIERIDFKEIILDNNAYEQEKTNEEIEKINISIKI